ncbi:MAG: (2Fe-2S)-binding protein [Betaproteobacteria bacterium]
MTHRVDFSLNGQPCQVQVEPRLLLVDLLREQLRLTGTHVGCDTSQCGCCTVLLDGQAVKSCSLLAVQAQGGHLTTIEGLAAPAGQALHPVQQAFTECHALQCGFCTPGMVMSTVSLLRRHPQPSPAEIEEGLAGHLCRCTGYAPIAAAVLRAAELLQEPGPC